MVLLDMSSRKVPVPPLVIAHRTCPRDAPENSIAGIEHARRRGADAVEMDVRLSSDGVPILLHDRWLTRTARRPFRVDRMTVQELRRRRTRGNGRIPTLAEGLAALGPTMKVALDVKDPAAAAAVVAEIRNQDLHDRVLFWSQHEAAVRFAGSRAPELEIAVLRDAKGHDQLERLLGDAASFGATAVSVHWSQVNRDLAHRCTDLGILMYAWCKRRTIDLDKLALLHGVVTDWPQIAFDGIARLGANDATPDSPT